MDDLYKRLGVPESASEHQIRRAYRKLAILYHPDRNPGRIEWASERFRYYTEAYEILCDEKKRKLYHQKRSEKINKGKKSTTAPKYPKSQKNFFSMTTNFKEFESKDAIMAIFLFCFGVLIKIPGNVAVDSAGLMNILSLFPVFTLALFFRALTKIVIENILRNSTETFMTILFSSLSSILVITYLSDKLHILEREPLLLPMCLVVIVSLWSSSFGRAFSIVINSRIGFLIGGIAGFLLSVFACAILTLLFIMEGLIGKIEAMSDAPTVMVIFLITGTVTSALGSVIYHSFSLYKLLDILEMFFDRYRPNSSSKALQLMDD